MELPQQPQLGSQRARTACLFATTGYKALKVAQVRGSVHTTLSPVSAFVSAILAQGFSTTFKFCDTKKVAFRCGPEYFATQLKVRVETGPAMIT